MEVTIYENTMSYFWKKKYFPQLAWKSVLVFDVVFCSQVSFVHYWKICGYFTLFQAFWICWAEILIKDHINVRSGWESSHSANIISHSSSHSANTGCKLSHRYFITYNFSLSFSISLLLFSCAISQIVFCNFFFFSHSIFLAFIHSLHALYDAGTFFSRILLVNCDCFSIITIHMSIDRRLFVLQTIIWTDRTIVVDIESILEEKKRIPKDLKISRMICFSDDNSRRTLVIVFFTVAIATWILSPATFQIMHKFLNEL